ncbi:MAG TPA: hypothetical protein VEC37_12525 [Bacillota bacterium]|nr:hypothetical protein [Bacillota bacterium]
MFVEIYRKSEGFTFLELIFVVLLLATLASVAMLNYSGLQEGTTRDLVKAELQVLRAALRSYYLEMNTFPADLNQLVTDKIMDGLPDDKFIEGSGVSYRYQRNSSSSAQVWSVGPNKANNSSSADDVVLQVFP